MVMMVTFCRLKTGNKGIGWAFLLQFVFGTIFLSKTPKSCISVLFSNIKNISNANIINIMVRSKYFGTESFLQIQIYVNHLNATQKNRYLQTT